MNTIFCIFVAFSIVLMLQGESELVLSAMLSGGKTAISLSLTLLAIYCVWLSVLKMMERLQLVNRLSRGFAPVAKRLFPNETDEAYGYIAINLCANMLGMGGAATPAGIRATSLMSDGSEVASHNMLMLLVINATSVQLLPMTVISMRAAAGSVAASDIILPSLLATACSSAVGISLCLFLRAVRRARVRNLS